MVKMKWKGGQVEVMGLVIIVILITLGMFFMLKFTIDEDPETNLFIEKPLLANGVMGALINTNVVCEDQVIETPLSIKDDLIDDCAIHKEINSVHQCGGKHSCEFLRETLVEQLKATLGKWRVNYELHSVLVSGATSEDLFPVIKSEEEDGTEKGCPGERESSGSFPINVQQVGLVENTLHIC